MSFHEFDSIWLMDTFLKMNVVFIIITRKDFVQKVFYVKKSKKIKIHYGLQYSSSDVPKCRLCRYHNLNINWLIIRRTTYWTLSSEGNFNLLPMWIPLLLETTEEKWTPLNKIFFNILHKNQHCRLIII